MLQVTPIRQHPRIENVRIYQAVQKKEKTQWGKRTSHKYIYNATLLLFLGVVHTTIQAQLIYSPIHYLSLHYNKSGFGDFILKRNNHSKYLLFIFINKYLWKNFGQTWPFPFFR